MARDAGSGAAHLDRPFLRLPGWVAARGAPSAGSGGTVPGRRGWSAAAALGDGAVSALRPSLGLSPDALGDPRGSGARPPAPAFRQRRLPPGRRVAADP